MYIPPHYEIKEPSEIRNFLKDHSFGILIGSVRERPWGTHIPLELLENEDGSFLLEGHMARKNPQWKYFDEGQEVLCIFNGPHAYVSSSWYKDEEVPTWDYMAVHVYGRIHFSDQAEVLKSLDRLIDKHEQDSEKPVSLHDFSEETLQQVQGVVGFRIQITETQAAFKLSQGREEDHPEIIRKLQEKGGMQREVSSAIKELKCMKPGHK